VKKVFKLTDPKKHEDRVLEAIKHDIRKYVKREKKKKLPDNDTMYWDFDCKVGLGADDAKVTDHEQIIKELDSIKSTGASEVYVEIVAKAVDKPVKS
jgi:RNA binding exosome subunit